MPHKCVIIRVIALVLYWMVTYGNASTSDCIVRSTATCKVNVSYILNTYYISKQMKQQCINPIVYEIYKSI